MKRTLIWSAVAACAVVAAPIVRADVKTTQKTQFKLAGLAGALLNHFGGAAARDGITSTVAVKGDRKSSINDLTGEIIDLDAQKVYQLNVKKKQYTVKTFDEIRAEYQKEQAEAAKDAKDQSSQEKGAEPEPSQPPAQQMQFDFNVKDTGQHKTIAGMDTHEEIVTLTGHVKGQTLEQGGGFVMTSDMWLAPKVAALDEVRQFDMKYYQAIYGQAIVLDPQQMAQMAAMYPQFQTMASQLQAEGSKLQGTPLSTLNTFDVVKSADQMKQMADAQQQQSQQPPPSSGSGIGGMFAKKFLSKKVADTQQQQTQQRTTAMTSSTDVLSIDTTVSDADVAIPAGYKQK